MPNLVSVIFTLAVLELSGVILTEAGLSFISMEMKPPTASWGLLIAQGKKYLSTAWWLAFFPGMAVFLTTMAFGLIAN